MTYHSPMQPEDEADLKSGKISEEFAKWQDKDFCKLHSFTSSNADSENCRECFVTHKENCSGCAKCES